MKFGYDPNNFGSTYSNSYKPVEQMRKSMVDNCKKTSIEFNPVKQGMEKTSIYKSDYLNRDE